MALHLFTSLLIQKQQEQQQQHKTMSWIDFAVFAFDILGLLGSIHVFLYLWAYQFPDGKVRYRLNPPLPATQVTLVIKEEDKALLIRAIESMENLETQARKPRPHPALKL